MPIDDDIIDANIITLNDKISESASTVKVLSELRQTFVSIQKTERRVKNDTGGYDVVTGASNPHNLSEEDNEKIRQLLYDNCLEKYSKLEF